ncbi:MAG: glucose 1-dehydrogenase [Devosia sp.]|nr:glucose 1-dehydrogenase [Devosia sp.]
MNGSSRGIGRAIAERLASEGARVVVTYNAHKDEAEAVVAGIAMRHGEATAIKADTSSESDVDRLIGHTIDTLGGLDIFVNNAGVMSLPGFFDVTKTQWDRTLAINLSGCFLAGQKVARQMLQQGGGGAIVNISSGGAFAASPGMTAYKVSKAGVEMLTRLMALELAPYGVRVNSIAPGLIATDINKDRLADEGYRGKRLSQIPMRVIGEPDDIAAGVLYLVSDEARLVSGACLRIDGGRAALTR